MSPTTSYKPNISNKPEKSGPKRLVHAQTGVTLVELMIGLLIGMIIAGAATAVFLAVSRLGKNHDDGAKMLEDGGFASARLVAAIRRAGYVDLLADQFVVNQILDTSTPLGAAIDSPTSTVFDKFGALYGSTTGLSAGIFGCQNGVFSGTGACQTQGTRDALTIAYQATTSSSSIDPFSPSVPTTVADGSAFSDCNGIPPAGGTDVVINRYYVTSNDELMCRGSGNNQARTLAINVDQFKVLYGVSNWSMPTDPKRRVVWQTASQVAATNRWNAVVQVDVCLMMKGPVGSAPNPARSNNCDGTTTSTVDTRARKTFRTVVSLRNVPL
jgi:type IV pilus assembly protein PilW